MLEIDYNINKIKKLDEKKYSGYEFINNAFNQKGDIGITVIS